MVVPNSGRCGLKNEDIRGIRLAFNGDAVSSALITMVISFDVAVTPSIVYLFSRSLVARRGDWWWLQRC